MTKYPGVTSEGIELHHRLVPVVVYVGGNQAQHDAENQRHGKLLNKVGQAHDGARLNGDRGVHYGTTGERAIDKFTGGNFTIKFLSHRERTSASSQRGVWDAASGATHLRSNPYQVDNAGRPAQNCGTLIRRAVRLFGALPCEVHCGRFERR